jgi:hypothetical protein
MKFLLVVSSRTYNLELQVRPDPKLTCDSGVGVGSLSVIVPMYNSECAPP